MQGITYDILRTAQDTRLNEIHVFTIITLLDHHITFLFTDWYHCIKYNFKLNLVEIAKHK